MTEQLYGLRKKPFALTPEPAFLFMIGATLVMQVCEDRAADGILPIADLAEVIPSAAAAR